MNRLVLLCAAALAGTSAHADAGSFFSQEAAFQLAAGPTGVESFESAPGGSLTELVFAKATVSCDGSKFCPNFFGRRSIGEQTAGRYSVFFATPDTITFRFAPTTAFGIDIMGLGTAGVTDMTVAIDNGDSAAVASGYSGGARLFAGYVSTTLFSAVTFRATAPDDGIDFDRLQLAGVVPEPATFALLALGLAGVGAAVRRRRG